MPNTSLNQSQYVVPALAVAGDTFEIWLSIGDLRTDDKDKRRDGLTVVDKYKWHFVVNNELPEAVSIISLTDVTPKGKPGPKETAGDWDKIMKAEGPAPAPLRVDWSGTAVNENVGKNFPKKGDELKFNKGILGVYSKQGVTFFFGNHGADGNQFKDRHGASGKDMILKDGFDDGTYYADQTYSCAGKSCTYRIWRTATRLDKGTGNERIKITVTTDPAPPGKLPFK